MFHYTAKKRALKYNAKDREVEADRKCPNCGRVIQKDARTCPYCSKKFQQFEILDLWKTGKILFRLWKKSQLPKDSKLTGG